MKVIFWFQDVFKIVNDSLLPLDANAIEAQRVAHRQLIKMDEKGLFLIHQCVNSNISEKIMEQETTNEAWDTLKKLYGRDEKLKKVKLQSQRKQYENLRMKDDEIIVKFFSKMVVTLKNQMKSYGKRPMNC